MSTTFAALIDSHPIYADRAEKDKDGNTIDTTYAKLTDIPTVPVTDVTVNGTSVVSSGTAAVVVPTATSDLQNDSGFVTLSDVPAQQQADWTESDSSDPSYIAHKPTLAAVATSGSYSDLSGTPTINNVPVVTSSDDDKVLKASYTDGVGSYSWETAESGGSYIAGDGINIDQSNIVSVRIKDDYDNPLKFTQAQGGGGYASLMTPQGTPSSEGWQALADNGYITYSYDDKSDETSFEFTYLWDSNGENPLSMWNMYAIENLHYDAKIHLLDISRKEGYTSVVATSNTVSDAFSFAHYASSSITVYSLGSVVDTTDDVYKLQVNFTVPGDVGGQFNAIAVSSSGTNYFGTMDTVQSSFLNETHVLAMRGSEVFLVAGEPVPGGDLYVQVDQTYDPFSALPQSGFAVDEAIGYVRQVPYAESSDNGKSLVYDDIEGAARWTDQSSASIARDGNSLEVRLRNASGQNISGLAVSTTETPTSITGTAKSGGPNSSYYAAFTKSMSLDEDTDTINIVGFEDSIPSEITSQVYAIVVAGDTWQSGTLTGGLVFDLNSGAGIDLSNPNPCKAYVITDPYDPYTSSAFFSTENTFMVFGVSSDNLTYDHGSLYGSFPDEWGNNGLYSAISQYAVAFTQPSGSVTFEIPSIPTVTRGLYVSNPLPASTSADEDKVLKVDANGDPTWATGGGGSTYTAGNGITIANNEISVDTTVVATKTDLSSKQDTLTAGTNVSITNNVISATDTTYTAGECIDITNNEISVDETVLYDCSDNYVYGTNSVTLSESYKNFEIIKILNSKGNVQFYYPANNQGVALFTLTNITNSFLWLIPWTFTSDTVFSGATGKLWTVGSTTAVDVASNAGSNRWIQPIKIIGVKRIAGDN